METTKQLMEINTENINKAIDNIKKYAFRLDYQVNGNMCTNTNLDFPSAKSKKKFKKSLNRIFENPTMKSINLFLHHLSKYSDSTLQLNYSDREAKIIKSRKEWKASMKLTEQLMKEYKECKGDYYKTFKQY